MRVPSYRGVEWPIPGGFGLLINKRKCKRRLVTRLLGLGEIKKPGMGRPLPRGLLQTGHWGDNTKLDRPNGSNRPAAVRRGCPLPGNQNRKLSQKRALALTHDRRFNRLRNVPSGPATRALSALFGKVHGTMVTRFVGQLHGRSSE